MSLEVSTPKVSTEEATDTRVNVSVQVNLPVNKPVVIVTTQKEERQRQQNLDKYESCLTDEYKRNILPGEPGSTIKPTGPLEAYHKDSNTLVVVIPTSQADICYDTAKKLFKVLFFLGISVGGGYAIYSWM